MTTENDRLNYLNEKINQLNKEIEAKGLQNKYAAMAKKIEQGKLKPKPVYDEDLEIMLPKEREKNLLIYYHTLRSERQMIMDDIKKQGSFEKATRWLENPWVKRGVTLTAIIKVAVEVGVLIAHSGLFYAPEENEDNRIV